MLMFKCSNCQTTLSCDEIYAGQNFSVRPAELS